MSSIQSCEFSGFLCVLIADLASNKSACVTVINVTNSVTVINVSLNKEDYKLKGGLL